MTSTGLQFKFLVTGLLLSNQERDGIVSII